MLIFLLMNSVVIASSLLLACKVFKFNLSIDYLITLFILYLAQIIATELFLGIFGILYLKNLILLNAGLLFLIWFTTRNKKFTCSFTGIKDALTQLFSDKVILLATAVILGFALVNQLGGDLSGFTKPVGDWPFWQFWHWKLQFMPLFKGGLNVSPSILIPISAVGAFFMAYFSVMAEGCPFRQHVMAGEGRLSGIIYIAGLVLGVVFFDVVIVPYLQLLTLRFPT